MKQSLFISIRLTLLCAVVFSGLYPLIIWGIAQVTPQQGKGERLIADGKTYYANIGQPFSSNRYFWPRPSAVDYHADGSGGSNYGPSQPGQPAAVQARLDTFLVHHPGLRASDVPVEMVTAGASGLDPHLSPQAAEVQAARVAAARGLDVAQVKQLIQSHTKPPLLGLFGPATVRVLELNLALDALK